MNSINELIKEFQLKRPVILVDNERRENEGDLVFPAEFISPEIINFMCKEARGLICLALSSEQIKRLKLPLMVPEDYNLSSHKTAFTVSIEAASGVSTGISAFDRSHTISVAVQSDVLPTDIVTPGHIFPLRAKDGGVLERPGHTEAGVDLARLAGLNPSSVICEIMNDDGSMARVPDLEVYAKKHNLKMGSIDELIQFRKNIELSQSANISSEPQSRILQSALGETCE